MSAIIKMSLLILCIALSFCGTYYVFAQDDDGGGGAADTGGESYSDTSSGDADTHETVAVDEVSDAGHETVESVEVSEEYSGGGASGVSAVTTSTTTTYLRDRDTGIVETAVAGGIAGAGIAASAGKTSGGSTKDASVKTQTDQKKREPSASVRTARPIKRIKKIVSDKEVSQTAKQVSTK